MKLSSRSLVLLVPALRSTFALATVASKAGTGVHKPVGKDGEGEYSAATKGCFDVIDTATPPILQEICKQDTISSNRAYHIADYGTADAGTSLGLLSRMVQTVRKHNKNEEQEIVLHYEDQLTNEWQSVFRHALGLKNVKDAYGNTVETPLALGNVYAEACGVGFHNQCYASNSIDFAVSFTAMHWLSSCDIASLGGTPYMHAARCPEPPKSEKEQAAQDWKAILRARSKELVKGGRFACVNFCVSKEGYFLGQTDKGYSMWDSFEAAWDQLHQDGLIDDEEKEAISFPSYYRTMDEFLEGIEEVGGFKVVSAEEKVVPCPYRELYTSGKTNLSEREYAEWFVPTTRTWSHSTFQSALHKERSDQDQVMAAFWENYVSLVAKNPTEHGMDYVHAYLVLEKQ